MKKSQESKMYHYFRKRRRPNIGGGGVDERNHEPSDGEGVHERNQTTSDGGGGGVIKINLSVVVKTSIILP